MKCPAVASLLVPLALLLAPACSEGPSLEDADLTELWRLANRGVGLVELGEYEKAVATWEEVMALAPNWGTARINHAIATLNTPNGEPEAIRLLEGILTDVPYNPWANYCLGLLENRRGDFEKAARCFRAVLAVDPEDPDSHYRLATNLRSLNRLEEAVRELERAIALAPRNQSAWYELSQVSMELGDADRRQEALAEFQSLRDSGRGFERDIVYGKTGFYGEVIGDFRIPPPPPGPPPAPVEIRFADATDEVGLATVVNGSTARTGFEEWSEGRGTPDGLSGGAAVADVDQDGDFDAVVANFGEGPDAFVLLNDAGVFADASERLGLGSGGARTIAVAAADFDGDALPEVFLGRVGADRIVAREFEDFTGRFEREIEGAGSGTRITFAVAVADLDQDGDLDLCLGRDRGVVFLRWEEERFEDVTQDTGIALHRPVMGLLAADVEGDGDLDVVVGTPSPKVLRNDRQWGFEEADLPSTSRAPVTSFALGDVNLDGLVDWVLSSPTLPLQLLVADRDKGFVADRGFAQAAARLRAPGSTLADVDRDGDLDCVTFGPRIGVLVNEGEKGWRDASAEAVPPGAPGFEGLDKIRGHVPIDVDSDGDLDFLAVRNGLAPLLVRNDTGTGADWAAILPQGVLEGAAARGRSLGLGSRVEVRTLNVTRTAYAGLGGGFGGIAPQVVHFHLGGQERFDLRVVWADGVQQPELDFPAGEVHVIEQHDKEAASCPLVFFWNGERFEYLTDCLGVGGIGFFVEPGLYGPPDPEEVVRLGETLAPRDGRYEVRLHEPMEEAVYLDEASLLRVDHPEGTRVHVDERFATGGAPATGRPLLVREAERVFPSRATSRPLTDGEAGEGREDATDESHLFTIRERGPRDDRAVLMEVDRRYAEPFGVHRRLLGYGTRWATELVFDAAPFAEGDDGEAGAGPVFLFVHGWIEYPYSRLNYAAWQAERRMETWTLEAPDGKDGENGWRPVAPELGYPAGKPRTMAFEVTDWLDDFRRDGELHLRLSSNLVVYLDQVFLARDRSAAALAEGTMRVAEAHPREAELAFTGFPREYSPDGRKPLRFDYQNRDASSPFKAFAGTFTELGDVHDLVTARDDRFAIYGRGEEVRLRFDPTDLAPADDTPPSPRTTWLLRVRGYCKDMCPQTAEPTTITPLPFAAMETYPPTEPLGAAHPSRLAPQNTRREPPRPRVR